MIKRRLSELNHNSKTDLRRRHKRIEIVDSKDKGRLKEIFANGYIKKWNAPCSVKNFSLKGRNYIVFPSKIQENNIRDGLIKLYDVVVKHAMPTMSYPVFNDTILSTMHARSQKIPSYAISITPLFQAASMAAYYHISSYSIRRKGGFKTIPMEPYFINLFHRATKSRDDSLLYCFVYTILSWVMFDAGVSNEIDKRMNDQTIQTPIDPSFQLYYRFVDLLRRLPEGGDIHTVLCFLMFKSITYFSQESLTVLLRLFDVNALFKRFLEEKHLTISDKDDIEAHWYNVDYDADTMISFYMLFDENPLVSRICEIIVHHKLLLPQGQLYFNDIADHLGDVTAAEVIYAFYDMFLSPILSTDTAFDLLRGFQHDFKIEERKSVDALPFTSIGLWHRYNDHAYVSGQVDDIRFDTLTLEGFISSLDKRVMQKIAYIDISRNQHIKPQYMWEITDKTNLYFSEHVNYPIYMDHNTMNVFSMNNSFLLPI